mmetsp:Transcript_108514/g.315589  ORF Transcript_108514/g.315589 Transcript_108514/m.315589 type:complete len:339 (-) Transcript_108514:616-1632(-)
MAMQEPAQIGLAVQYADIMADGDIPVQRGGHSAVAVESQLVVFGGHSYSGQGKFAYYNDVHVFDAESSTWHLVNCRGELPAPRYGHTVELVGSRMFLFGGKGEGGVMRDIHFLDLVEWTWVPVSATSAGPSPRMNMASLLVGRKIVVHGGWDGTKKCVNDLWVFDTDAFTWLNPRTAGLPPVARYGHALQLLEDGRILMFGGMSVNDGEIPEYFNDFRALDTETMVWSKVRAESEEFPSSRYGHSLTQLGPDLMVLFGGWGLGGLQCKQENSRRGADSLVVYDVPNSMWLVPAMPSKPVEHRYGHTCTAMGDSLFVFGGWTGKQAVNGLTQIMLQDMA